MPVPDFQTLMLPVLQRVGSGTGATRDLVVMLSDAFQLSTEERAQLLPSGRQTTIANRVHWALAHLGKAGLIRRVSRGQYALTSEGRATLAAPPERITMGWLGQFPSYSAFRAQTAVLIADHGGEPPHAVASSAAEALDPEEAFEKAAAELDAALAVDLLDAVRAMPDADFERLLIALLRSLGFGGPQADAARRLGGTGDGGVDGVIREDALGLDALYVQAKRYTAGNTVGSGAVREFAGALLTHGARKGVFATTSAFTAAAKAEAERLATHQRIVLLDGVALSKLMLDYDVGVRTTRVVKRRRVDLSIFSEDADLD